MDAFLVMTGICMVFSFAICGIPFGLIISERQGVDVRQHGSGNIGMTNVARTLGGKAAGITFACDVGKGVVCALVSRILLGLVVPVGSTLAPTDPAFAAMTLVYACCVLGHVFSPYLNFKGGKGISVGFGAVLNMYWPVGAILMAVFLLLALPTRFISLGSVAAALSLPIQCLFLWHFTPWACLPMLIVTCVVVWAHRGNIVKLVRGEESRFTINRQGGKTVDKGSTLRRD